MEAKPKENYEAPATLVVEVKTDSAILLNSRDGYGDAYEI